MIFLQRATSATYNEEIFATSNEQILQRVTSDFTMTNEQRVNQILVILTFNILQYFLHNHM